MRYRYKTTGTCAQYIDLDIDDNVITNIVFYGGCNGNLKAISKLVNGWTVEKIEQYLLGNICGMKGTSCADQLAKGVRAAYNETHK